MLLSTSSSLWANSTEDIWINKDGNVEMVPDFYMNMVNKLKYTTEKLEVMEEVVATERVAHTVEREAWELERMSWQDLEKEMNGYVDALQQRNNYLERQLLKVSIWNKVLIGVSVVAVAFAVVN